MNGIYLHSNYAYMSVIFTHFKLWVDIYEIQLQLAKNVNFITQRFKDPFVGLRYNAIQSEPVIP